MSEFTQTNDSAASGMSEASEYQDVNDNLDAFFHENKDSSFFDHFHSLCSGKNEEAQTRQLTGKIRRTSGGVGENSCTLNGRNMCQIKPGFNAPISSYINPFGSGRWTIDSSPDSGLGYTGSSPSAFGYLHSSSGFGSEIDTSDFGTPNSLELVIHKASPTQYTTKKLRTFFKNNYTFIKEELDPGELADILYSRDLIRKGDREKITELKFRERKSDCLIKSLVLKSLKTKEEHEDKFVDQVLKSFQEAKYGYIMKMFAEFTEPNHGEEIPINCDWKKKLKYVFSTNGNEIDTLEIVDKLLEDDVLEFHEHTLILDATTRSDKLECLLESILNKSFRHYSIFCNLVKKESPNLSQMLLDESVYERMDITERCNSPKLDIKVLKEFKCDDGETEVKLFIDSTDGYDNELEEMIVDQNSPRPSESLVEMVTEDVQCNCSVSFSCIKITLENYSEQALMILIEKCKASPKFLERWIKELIDEDKMKKLKERNIKEIKFKIQVRWPEIVLRKQDIARNYGFLKDILEPKDYTDILKEDNEAQEVLEVIASSESKEERAKTFLTYLVTSSNQELLEKISAQLKGTETISNLVKEKRSEYIKRCSCKLTKNIIVETFSFLEEKVKNLDEIIDIFANCPYLANTIKEKFQAVKIKETGAFKMGAFLRKILELPDDGIQVCLFQDALIQTKQNELLKEILEKVSPKKVSTLITRDDISRNLSFLKQELEPMRFVTMLAHDPNLNETILEINSRKQRCDVFLDYLKECSATKLGLFSSELKELQLTYITDYLVSSRFQGDAENKITKQDISNNMCFLDDMIDPLELRHLLSGNEKDKSRTALATVLSTSKKKKM